MGIQTMASQAGGGGGGGSGGQRSPKQDLARQGSLYNLTLDEVQSHLGEPLLSMNLDELLKSILPAEAVRPLAGMDGDGASIQYASGSGLQRQGSITMPQELSKKTVDEVWKGIQQGEKGDEEQKTGHERQPTFGEITLEDFLLKAGVVLDKDALDIPGNLDPVRTIGSVASAQDFSQGVQWFQQYQPMAAMDPHQQGQPGMISGYMLSKTAPQPLRIVTGPVLDVVYPEGQMSIPSPVMAALSDPQTPARKRASLGEVVDKSMERRQKRMIKNRESAARSRARKQAYTNELENKVTWLEAENERLKQQKKWDLMLQSESPVEPKFRLRRMSSAPF